MIPDEPRAGEEGEAPQQADPGEAPPADPDTPRGRPRPADERLEVLDLDDLDDDETLDEAGLDDDEDEDDVRTVLITGASGSVARKLREAWGDAYDFVLIDKDPDPTDPDVLAADLSAMDEGWISHFHGADTVIHLAGNADEHATWEELQGPNLDALANVLNAAALAGVERVIFASSHQVMAGYRALAGMTIGVDLPPKPETPYAASKLMGERLGRSLAAAFDLSFVALRLGVVQPGRNRPETLPDDWSRSSWLSDGDLVRLVEAAVEAELADNQSLVVNGVSNNRGGRWDLTTGTDALDYVPEDDAYAEDR